LDSAGTCSLTREATQGPYWFDVDSIRSDLREDRPGTTLQLALRVWDASCEPLGNSVVEIWHCDAGGMYSGFEVASGGAGGVSDGSYSEGVQEAEPSDDGTYLRGAQVADENGIVQFTTIYPGWYTGRTVHIHLKVHVDRENVLTTQLYFDDELSDTVFSISPYDEHPNRNTRNDT
ncbi:intradiol ring-cleavage dioxygenase, partial [Phytoactinopolyspora endophytica]|uniref:intradiol ring-cleavage dioxygenase n=1 Tax=Phytoactinopolyspora endophytica TaxID=1642495 RepID=UPI003B8301AB